MVVGSIPFSGFLTVYVRFAAMVLVASGVNWTTAGIVPSFTIADTDGSDLVDAYDERALRSEA